MHTGFAVTRHAGRRRPLCRHGGAARGPVRRNSSWCNRRPPPGTRACSITCCPHSPPDRESRQGSSRSAPGRRSGTRATGTGTCCSCTRNAPRRAFVTEGFGVERFDLMYNDFVIVGPAQRTRPVSRGCTTPSRASRRIARAGAAFASRGDDSGTHRKELESVERGGDRSRPGERRLVPRDRLGDGSDAEPRSAGMGAYTLTDRATWTAFDNKGDFTVHVEGDARLINQYGVILVNPREASAREGSGRPGVHRLGARPGRPARNRLVQGRRPAALLPEREAGPAGRAVYSAVASAPPIRRIGRSFSSYVFE